jgi:stage V sporulation protein G
MQVLILPSSLILKKLIKGDHQMKQFIPLKVLRVKLVEGSKHLRAFADLSIMDAFIVKGVKVVEGESGNVFVSMPQEPGKTGNKFFDIVTIKDKEIRDLVSNIVLKKYRDEKGLPAVAKS